MTGKQLPLLGKLSDDWEIVEGSNYIISIIINENSLLYDDPVRVMDNHCEINWNKELSSVDREV